MTEWLRKQWHLMACAVRLMAAIFSGNQAAFNAVRADIEATHE